MKLHDYVSDDIQERHGSKSNVSSESINVGSSSVEKRRPKVIALFIHLVG